MASRWHAGDDDELFSTVAAAERTALAWERSGFSIAAIGALLFHAGEKADSWFEILAGGLALLLALTVVGVFFVVMELRAPHMPTEHAAPASQLPFRAGLVYLAVGGATPISPPKGSRSFSSSSTVTSSLSSIALRTLADGAPRRVR